MSVLIVHYVPEANGPTRDQRVSRCGVRTRVGGPREWDESAAWGSSNLQNVTCAACLKPKE